LSILYGNVGDYTNPILKPQAAEVVKKHGEIELSGALAPNPRNQCWPGGIPFVLTSIGMQMFQQPDKITILYSDTYEVRRVRMNEPHAAHVTPSSYVPCQARTRNYPAPPQDGRDVDANERATVGAKPRDVG
jgi:hypothetical protein